jgi:oxygen-independent coproporphyrinogen III oxidase
MSGLYVHIPFCVSKCRYCDFYSVAGQDGLLDRYISVVLQESEKYRNMQFTTLYIGGGTPSLLGVQRLERLMDGLSERLDLHNLTEASMEVNPESAGGEFLKAALCLGINRISIGVQSLCDDELRKSGRIHNARQALDAVNSAVGCGFAGVSADVIVGLPGQTPESLAETLSSLCDTGLTHLSAYCLSVEEHTPFFKSPPADLPDDAAQSDLFNLAVNHLKKRGFVHYEISNFSLPGRECRHNLNYWRGGEYAGLGPSAASHLGGIRLKNAPDLPAYLRDPLGIAVDVDLLNAGGRIAEEAMLRLRLLEEGLDLKDLARPQAESYCSEIRGRLDRLADEHLLVRTGSRYRLPPEGVLTANQVFLNVID